MGRLRKGRGRGIRSNDKSIVHVSKPIRSEMRVVKAVFSEGGRNMEGLVGAIRFKGGGSWEVNGI